MDAFMLESLMDEQRFLLICMERAAHNEVPERWELSFALETVVTAIRDLRDQRITWFEALKIYHGANACRHNCELALMFPILPNSPGYQHEKGLT